MTDKCPWCGAAATTMLIGRETVYECHSFGMERSRDCKFRASAMARIESLEVENERVRKSLSKFAGFIRTCRLNNTKTWMESLAERLNAVSAALGTDEYFHSPGGCIMSRKK